MKLIIQIPCYNEENNIFHVLNSIPKKINGIDEIHIVVLDDGSFDSTVKIADDFNTSIIKSNHIGLGGLFNLGLKYAIENNADTLVNLDSDNQYNVNDIEKLMQPILKNKADITIGTRPFDKIKTFSFAKKYYKNLAH